MSKTFVVAVNKGMNPNPENTDFIPRIFDDDYQKAHDKFKGYIEKYWADTGIDRDTYVDRDNRTCDEILESDHYYTEDFQIVILKFNKERG